VTPAQQLMVIVPGDSHLEAEAMISNRDIGFVSAGQPIIIFSLPSNGGMELARSGGGGGNLIASSRQKLNQAASSRK
jgi:hypothetical protein